MEPERACVICGEVKSASEFYIRKHRVDIPKSRWKQEILRKHECKACVKERSLKRYRNNTEKIKEQAAARYRKFRAEDWGAMRFKQSLTHSRTHAKRVGFMPCIASEEEIKATFTGKCHVCGVPEIECQRCLALDHCHETGIFRGWLCAKCNKAAGLLGESIQNVLSLAAYIERAGVTTDGK